MIPGALTGAFSNLPAALAEPAVRSIVLACVAGLTLTVLRVKSAAQRLAVWRLVLYAALVMPLLGWMVPALPFSVPAPRLAQATSSGAAEPARASDVIMPSLPTVAVDATLEQSGEAKRLSGAAAPATTMLRSAGRAAEAAPAPGLWERWKLEAGAVYAAVMAILLARFVLGVFLSRRIERVAQTIDDPRLLDRLQFHARAAGLKRLPRLAESEAVLVPVTCGVRRPAILLPVSWREWSDAELDAVMAHEMSHVARRDALTQQLSQMHSTFFWFSPLSWWLDRRLAQIAEEASDEAALALGADRGRYAETLLNFFSQLESVGGRIRWQGVSMATSGNAERRVDRILAWKGAASSRLRKSLAVSFAIIAPPVVLFAAAAHPILSYQQEQSPTAPRAPLPPPAVAPAPEATPAPWPRPAPYAIAPIAPVAAIAPLAPQSPTNYVFGDSEGQSFAISFGKNFVYVGRHGVNIGSSEDSDEIHWLRSKVSGDFIYFERDGKYYVIKDQATVKRAWDLFEPARALGVKQEELGKKQEALGEQQEALGEKISEVKVKIPDMTQELEKVRANMKQLTNGGTQEELGELQAEIGELQARIGELQSEAGREQSKIGREQGELGRRQGELGRQQGELGRQQGELSRKATREMRSLLDDAFAKGLAKPE